jgi:hypothetical protein
MASRISCNKERMSLSDIDQGFLHKRKITGFDGPTGYKVNFLLEKIFQFMRQFDKSDPYATIEINQYINVAVAIIISPGIGAEYPQLRNRVTGLKVRLFVPENVYYLVPAVHEANIMRKIYRI